MTVTQSLELPRPWLPLVVATYVALGILFAGVAVAQYGLVELSRFSVREAPEFAHLQIPLLLLTIGFGVCVQAGIIAIAALVAFVRSGRILEPRAVRGVDALVAAVTAAGLITVALTFFVPGPPGLMLAIVVAGVALLVLDLLLLVLRSLLRRVILLRTELDEVV